MTDKDEKASGTDKDKEEDSEKKKGVLGGLQAVGSAVGSAAGKLTGATTAPEKKEPPPRPKLIKGTYVVHVHVIEARDLKGRDISAMSDPVAKVEVMGQKQHTRIHKKALSVVFDEVFVFEFKDIYGEEIERGKCIIRILDANTFRSDVLIGLFEFDLAQIYYKDHHELYRQWCALSDVTDKHEGIQGYLKCSITVLGPNDEQHVHTAAEADDDDGGMLGVLMPPEVEQRGSLLRVQALYVDELPVMDEGLIGGKCDPYIRVEFAGIDISTPHDKSGLKVDLLTELSIPVMEPTMSNTIKIHCYDYDQAGSDDRIASFTMDYDKIKDAPDRKIAPAWYPMYGAPEGKQSGVASKMNRGYLPGSWYRGKVMLAFSVEDNKEPKKDRTACNGIPGGLPTEQWKIEFDLYEGSEIPDKGKTWIEVHCGKQVTTSTKQEIKEGQGKWYEPLKDLICHLPGDPAQCPDVFVYLCCTSKLSKVPVRYSFIRFKMTDLKRRGFVVPPVWHIFTECKALDALGKSEFPGSVLFSLRVGLLADAPPEPDPRSRPLKYDNVDLESLGETDYSETGDEGGEEKEKEIKYGPDGSVIEDKKVAPSKRYDEGNISKVGTLKVTLVEGTNLPAMDNGGTSDPFCKLKIQPHASVKSKVIKKNLNPKWDQTFEFKDVSIESPLELTVYDSDLVGDDQIGFEMIDLKSMQIASKVPFGKDFQHDDIFFLQGDKSKKAQIRLKFDFKYVSVEESKVKQAAIEKTIAKKEKSFLHKIKGKKVQKTAGSFELGNPERKACQLRCHIYQARGLPALDSNGLADPYVVIRCAGQKIKLGRKEKTLNPQWYQTAKLNVQVPYPWHFAPRIQIFVFDWDQFGEDENMARFSISFQEAAKRGEKEELEPTWYKLTDFEGQIIEGAEILCAFQLLSAKAVHDSGDTDQSIVPKTLPMSLEITTLGLRGLQSTLGVHKTFIDFELPNGKRFHTRESNQPSSASPNFLQVLKLPVDLPIKKIFAPTLLIEVRDVLFGGLVKRVIGTAALDMSKFMIPDEKGEWKPASGKIDLASEDDIQAELKEDEKKARDKKAAELHKKMHEEQRKLDEEEKEAEAKKEEEKKEEQKKEEAKSKPTRDSYPTSASGALEMSELGKKKDDLKQPLLSGSSSDKESKVEVKDDGMGVGDIGGTGGSGTSLEEGSPLLADQDPKKVKEEFKDADQKFHKYDPADDAKTADDPEEIPAYMRGRVTIDDELEDTMTLNPFYTIQVSTGKKSAGPLALDKFRKVGAYKGLIRLMEGEKKHEKDDGKSGRKGTVPKEKKEEKKEDTEIDTKELLQPVQLYCRLYVLRGITLAPKDSDGKSDPYLIIKLGSHKISTRDRYIKNTLDPGFFEAFEIPCTLPGDAKLEITCMDWDGIGDDLIGKTEIDIEDRWFTKEWRKFPLKPLERRTLRSKTSNHSQGKLELWVELMDPERAKREPILDIKPPPPDQWELRTIIWGCRDVTIKDTFTNQNDLFITCACSIPGLKKQETDTHFRSKKGKGNFNWRMKFPVSLPIAPWPRLRFQIWDFDVFAPDDSICEVTMSLKGLCKRAIKKKDRIKIYVKGKERFWLNDLRHPNFKGNQGRMEISIELMPVSIASQLPAGLGRSNPNANPFLPEPEGRINWSLFHPFDMLKEILGPEIYRKLCLGCFCALCVTACAFMMPMVGSTVIGNILTP